MILRYAKSYKNDALEFRSNNKIRITYYAEEHIGLAITDGPYLFTMFYYVSGNDIIFRVYHNDVMIKDFSLG